jgi:hypothetical protein
MYNDFLEMLVLAFLFVVCAALFVGMGMVLPVSLAFIISVVVGGFMGSFVGKFGMDAPKGGALTGAIFAIILTCVGLVHHISAA